MKGSTYTKIPAELVSAATNGIVVSADGVYDYINNKNQETINSEKANKSETVSNISYSNGKLSKTINGTTTEVADLSFSQTQADWDLSDNTKVDFIKNKPTIPAAQVNADWTANSGIAQILNKPTIPAALILSDWSQSDNTKLDYIKNKPSLATVATTGDYEDLTNKPTIPTVPTNVSSFTNDAGYTTNTGTITGIQMNGESKGTSGVVNLGTVITDISGKQDTISDLTTIREGASAGATAYLKPSGGIPASDLAFTPATLTDGKVPASQLPSYVDDVIEVETFGTNAPSEPSEGDLFFNTSTNKLYVQSSSNWVEQTPVKGIIYVNSNKIYRWSGSTMIEISSDTNTFRKVKVNGSDLLLNSDTTDLNLVLGNGVAISGNSNGSVTISSNIDVAAGSNINSVGTPSVSTSYDLSTNKTILTFDYLKGASGSNGSNGTSAGFGTPTATVDANTGTPEVTVSATGPDTAKVFSFEFKNLKGANGTNGTNGTSCTHSWSGTTLSVTSASGTSSADLKGAKGDDGDSVKAVQRTLGSGAAGTTDTYTMYSDTAKTNAIGTFTVTNGSNGTNGTNGTTPTITASATVDSNTGTPSVTVTKGGTDAAPTFAFAFSNLKGETGAAGQNATTTAVASTSAAGLVPATTAAVKYLQTDASGVVSWGDSPDTQVTNSAVTTASTLYLTGSLTSTTTTGILHKHASVRASVSSDNSDISGYARLMLGNATATTTAGGKEGVLRLYGTSATYYTDLKAGAVTSSNKTITFPNNTGTVALTSDIPSISLNGSSTTSPSFYAPTSAGTSGQYLTSSGSGAPTWTTLSSTDTKVTQTNTTASGAYRVLLSGSANDTTATEGARKSTNLQFNPSTGCLTTKSVAYTAYTGTFSSGALSINATNGDLQIFTPSDITGDISGITISNAVAGQCITVIIYNGFVTTATRSITIANSSTYICPNNENISLSLPQGCYCEISFLAKSSSEFFVRAI